MKCEIKRILMYTLTAVAFFRTTVRAHVCISVAVLEQFNELAVPDEDKDQQDNIL